MGAFGYYGVQSFKKKISIFHVAPTGQREQHFGSWLCQLPNNFLRATVLPLKSTLKMKLSVSFLNNFLTPCWALENTSVVGFANFQTIFKQFFMLPLRGLIKNKHTLYKDTTQQNTFIASHLPTYQRPSCHYKRSRPRFGLI